MPQVTYLIRALRAKGFDISDSIFTIEEAKKAILSIFASNSTRGDK